ncbi:hypothetical protein IKN40_06165 [bacterium]|nr:hypothetical protein [bacterium]
MKQIITECPYCHNKHIFNVTDEQYNKYVNGESYIQTIFPKFTPTEREMLITGICGECWDKIFGSEED